MQQSGGCRCGAVRFTVEGDAQHVTLCHCGDCRRSSGAPMVAWGGFDEDQFRLVQGAPKTLNTSGDAWRSFCGDCGTGLFYRNETVLPGMVDIQVATLDDPETMPPSAHIQTAERLHWMVDTNGLPGFERYPPA